MASCTGHVVSPAPGGPEVVGPAGRLPAALRRELARRADARARELGDGRRTARLGDLARCAVHGHGGVHGQGGVHGNDRPPTLVMSVAALAADPAPAEALERAVAAAGAHGVLVALEPYRPPGLRGWLADRAAGAVRARYGVRVDLPVPALVREAGFVISSIERFTMPTRVLPLRPFVEIVARPAPVPEGGAQAGVRGAPEAGGGR